MLLTQVNKLLNVYEIQTLETDKNNGLSSHLKLIKIIVYHVTCLKLSQNNSHCNNSFSYFCQLFPKLCCKFVLS